MCPEGMVVKRSMFAVFGNDPVLEPNRGDRINEWRMLRSLTPYFDIYYNNILIGPNDAVYGRPDVPVSMPSRTYDLHYIRANAELFLACPSPKVTLAFPYNEEVWRAADAVTVYTERNKEVLETYNHNDTSRQLLSAWIKSDQIPKTKVVNVQQASDPRFRELPTRKIWEYRARFTNGFIAGFFGRLAPGTYPPRAAAALKILHRSYGDVVFVAGGAKRTTKVKNKIVKGFDGRDHVYVGDIPYPDMVAAVKACDIVMNAEDPEGIEWLGSGKVLDAVVAETPVLCRRGAAREEQLGVEYPFFYDTVEDAVELLLRFRSEPSFRDEIISALRERQPLFSQETISRRFVKVLEEAGVLRA